jgi:hypothetical protein
MSGLGWCEAAIAGAVATLALVTVHRRAVCAARAAHEVRGPLCAVLLGLERMTAGGDPLALAAVELELRRAALALDELGSPRRAGGAAELVDLGGLLTAAAAGWSALAARTAPGLGRDVPRACRARRSATARSNYLCKEQQSSARCELSARHR